MEHPKPLRGPTGPMIQTPGQVTPKQAVNTPTSMGDAMKKREAKPRIFKRGLIPEPGQLPKTRTSARVQLIYNLLKGIVLIGHQPHRKDPAKMHAALNEIKEVNKELYDRVRTYYDRLKPDEIAFFVGPRPSFLDDGKLAIYDHNRDNPLLQTIIKEERPEDVREGSLAPISKLALPKRLGGII